MIEIRNYVNYFQNCENKYFEFRCFLQKIQIDICALVAVERTRTKVVVALFLVNVPRSILEFVHTILAV